MDQQTQAPLAAGRASVAIGFVSGMVSGLTARGVDPAPHLRAVGLDPKTLRDSRARVPLANYADLYNRLVAALDDEGFGLFSVKLRAGMFAFLCRSLLGSRDLAEALDRAAQFLRLVLPDLVLRIDNEDGVAAIIIREAAPLTPAPNDPRRVFAFEWLLRLIHGLSCWLVGRGIALDSVQFPYAAPPQASDYALIYTAHPTFGGDALIAHLKANLLALPVRRDHAELARFLEGAPGKITMLYRRDREMVRQVRDVLAAAFPESPTLDEIAGRLHLSLRTVQRRLEEEGSGFRAIKSALRRDIALARLEKTSRSIAEIAVELGYAETSAFFRAFVDWTGEAPTHYRKRLRLLSSPNARL